jgi:hypothetical protein
VDVAVYFAVAQAQGIDIESERLFPTEDEIWTDVESILHRDVDLVVLNRAPATLAASVFYDGEPIIVRDPDRHREFFLRVTLEAEEFRGFIKDYLAIKRRSRSISEGDGARLSRVVER